jgi:hypothetical protein
MNVRKLLAVGVLAGTVQGLVAQTNLPQAYMLAPGSQLIDDCPVCGRPTILAPMTGSFGLRLLDQNPLFTRYELVDINFHAGTGQGQEYKVVGSGVYRVGGEVAYLQDAFLDVQINNGYTTTEALCTNSDREIQQKWPKLQISLDQTNGIITQVYHLTLVAIPVPQLRCSVADIQTGTVQFQWPTGLGSVQVERAFTLSGPFAAVTPITTNSSFADPGVLTNHPQVFYRVRLY